MISHATIRENVSNSGAGGRPVRERAELATFWALNQLFHTPA